jgi:site-specific DNA-cytosine methylase
VVERTLTVFFLFCGSGLGALGFAQAGAARRGVSARFEVLGGIDNDPFACSDFELLTGVRAHCEDITAMSPADLRAICPRRPDVVVYTAPCKGGSLNVGAEKAAEPKYQAMNELALVGLRLVLGAWGHDPPLYQLFENVPNLRHRAPEMIAELRRLQTRAGYALHDQTFNCGELAPEVPQDRTRWLSLARLRARAPAFVRVPPLGRPRSVGAALAALPMPGDPAGGPMHTLPRISWLNWMRLALIPAGGDWHDIPEGPFALRKHPTHDHVYGVLRWDRPAHTVTGKAEVGSGPFSVADPRLTCAPRNGAYGVLRWDEAAHTITGAMQLDNGPASVADPRWERAWRATPKDPPVIVAADGTWHRPLTTLELAVLMGLPATWRGAPLAFAGRSHTAWREHIGNGLPVGTARAIGTELLRAHLLAGDGAFELSAHGIWVESGREAVMQ